MSAGLQILSGYPLALIDDINFFLSVIGLRYIFTLVCYGKLQWKHKIISQNLEYIY